MSARLAGTSAAIYYNTDATPIKIADVFDWKLTSDAMLLKCDIKGDLTERWIPSHESNMTFTAKRRNEGVALFPAFLGSTLVGTRGSFRLDLIDANAGFTQISCVGWVKSISLDAPQEGVADELVIQIDEAWTYNV